MTACSREESRQSYKTPLQKTLQNDWMTYLLLHYGNMTNAALSLSLVAMPGQQLSFSYTQSGGGGRTLRAPTEVNTSVVSPVSLLVQRSRCTM